MKTEKQIKAEIEKVILEMQEISEQNDEWVVRSGWVIALRWVLNERETNG